MVTANSIGLLLTERAVPQYMVEDPILPLLMRVRVYKFLFIYKF